MHNRYMRSGFVLVFVLALVLVVAAGAAMAGQGQGKVKVKHSAASVSEQVYKAVYAPATLKPQAPVTNVEAVAEVIKLLGWEEQARTQAGAQLSFRDAAAIPGWATGYIAVAVEKGLIPGTGQFQPMKKATRLYVTVLLVKALNAEVGRDMENPSPSFTDIGSVSPEGQRCIALAVLNDLVKGYGDRTFKPNKPVTRAEFSALLARLQNRIHQGLQTRIAGQLLAVNVAAGRITVATTVYLSDVASTVYGTDNNLRAYEFVVAPGASIYRDGKPATLAGLQSGDRVSLLLNSSRVVVYLKAQGTPGASGQVQLQAGAQLEAAIPEAEKEQNLNGSGSPREGKGLAKGKVSRLSWKAFQPSPHSR
ncbi:MAG: S-layer homology domain-containing protein [Syntrophomonadaceae bacterium]|nr:S-layer homology domain-containing protein [Syntrophomonadaceae bacterium]